MVDPVRVRKYVQNLRRKLSEAGPDSRWPSKPYVVSGIASSTTRTAMKTYRLSPMRLRASLAREPRWRIQPRELHVLRAIRDGRVARDPLYGDLAPWMLGTRQVSWSVTLLVLHRLVRLGAFGLGPPRSRHGACGCWTAGSIFALSEISDDPTRDGSTRVCQRLADGA